MTRSLRAAAMLAAALLASACSHMPDLSSLPSMPGQADEGAAPNLSARERVRTAIDLLGEGNERRARAELRAVLQEQPNNNVARRLMDQIEQEPSALLAGTARAYTVRQGETMSQLAERFQGDALLFYALARYNNLAAANQVSQGQTLMIPRRPGVNVIATASTPMEALPPAPGAAPPATTPALRSTSGVDPARANQLRLQGLQQLNGGQVDRAVSLLRQALALDEGNPAIQRDLDRAVRLQTSLRSSSN